MRGTTGARRPTRRPSTGLARKRSSALARPAQRRARRRIDSDPAASRVAMTEAPGFGMWPDLFVRLSRASRRTRPGSLVGRELADLAARSERRQRCRCWRGMRRRRPRRATKLPPRFHPGRTASCDGTRAPRPGRPGHQLVGFGHRRRASRISTSMRVSVPRWAIASSTAAPAIAIFQPRPTSASRADLDVVGPLLPSRS